MEAPNINADVEKYNESIERLVKELFEVVAEIENALRDVKGSIHISSGDWDASTTRYKFGTGYIYTVSVTYRYKRIPASAGKLGDCTYVYGDFDNYVEYIDADDLEDAIDELPEFIEKIREFLQEKTEDFAKKAEEISKLPKITS